MYLSPARSEKSQTYRAYHHVPSIWYDRPADAQRAADKRSLVRTRFPLLGVGTWYAVSHRTIFGQFYPWPQPLKRRYTVWEKVCAAVCKTGTHVEVHYAPVT